MNRINLLFALCATTAMLASQGCGKSGAAATAAPGAPQQTTPTATPTPTPAPAATPTPTPTPAAGATPMLRIDSDAAVLPGGQFAVDVSFRDASGNLLDVSAQVTVALGDNPNLATLTGTKIVTAVNGVARFTDLSVDKVGTGYTLTAAARGATSPPGVSFKATWSEDDQLTVGTAQNNTAATAQAISPSVPVFGSLTDGVRYYRFRGRTGQILTVSNWANRLDLANWDTSLRLRLIAPNGTTEIARSGAADRTANGIDNGILALRLPADGDYFLACDADAGGFLSGKYAIMMTLLNPFLEQTKSEALGAIGQNGTQATAQPLLPGMLLGEFDTPRSNASNSDFYKITVPFPARIRVDLVAARNGAPYGDAVWDTRLEMQDASGAVLWANDDTYSKDPVIDYVVTKTGTYYLRVGHSASPANTASSPYVLTYLLVPYAPLTETSGNTSAASATAIKYGLDVTGALTAAGDHFFAFGGAAGDVIRLVAQGRGQLQTATLNLNPNVAGADAVLLGTDGVTALSAGAGAGNGTESKLNIRQTILQTTGTYFVRVRSPSAGRFGLRVERVAASAREVEPNDTMAQATPIDATGWISGVLGAAGDTDHFKVHAEAGQLVSVSVLAAPGGGAGSPSADWGSALMPTLEVRDAQANVLAATSADRQGNSNFAETDQRADPMVEAAFRAPLAGDYDVSVADADGQGGPAYFYALQVRKNQ